ncbi:MAG TPA: hypothetical protein VKT83_18225 [bacterium]|nr:hypothetical protein [bacterium]
MAVLVRDQTGRVSGIVVFTLGVLLLLVVFYLAYLELVASGALAGTAGGRSAGDIALFVAAKGLFLFVLGFVASAIANKGIALYQAAGGQDAG